MVKFVFLDLDDTIFDFHASEGKALSDTLRSLGVEPTGETLALYNRINRGQWERLERGEATREEILVRRFEILFKTLGMTLPAREAQKIYEHNLSLEYIYIDGIARITGKELAELSDIFGAMERLEKEYGVKFVLTCSAAKEDLPEFVLKYVD